jgi:hypothetical protein
MTIAEIGKVFAEAFPASYFRVKPVDLPAFWSCKGWISQSGTVNFVRCNSQGEEKAHTQEFFIGIPEDFTSVKLAEEDRKYGSLIISKTK